MNVMMSWKLDIRNSGVNYEVLLLDNILGRIFNFLDFVNLLLKENVLVSLLNHVPGFKETFHPVFWGGTRLALLLVLLL